MYPDRLYRDKDQFARSVQPAFMLLIFLLLPASAIPMRSAVAQVDRTPEISGLLFADYDYTVTSPEGELDGRNGFGYRRIYLTFDFPVSERLSGRVRFETDDSKTTDDGLPAPFVKDLYLTIKEFPAPGHSATFGIHPTPNFRLSEDVWGYRSLEKTVQDRAGAVSSRDMGISFTGPVSRTGTLRYRLMAANNSGVRAETDKYKRLYGAVELVPESIYRIAAGGDYYRFPTGTSTNLFVFAGVETGATGAGIELFTNEIADDAGPDPIRSGMSLFATYSHADDRKVIGRLDLTGIGTERLSTDTGYALVGYSFGIDDQVEIIPNLEYWFADGSDDGTLRARLTISATL